ncbi:MAG: PmoA family protein [Pirellulales bacterium]|nr:PmoA family protein [Pirellulales bacterium]
MPHLPDRREFLIKSLLAAPLAAGLPGALALAGTPKREPGADKLTAYQIGPHIWIRWNNHLLTSYRAHRSQKYPYLYPLAGPVTGLSLTSETCVPYPHHRSCLFGCDALNGANYWQDALERGQVLSDGPKLGKCTPTSAEILDACQWQQPGQPVDMSDTRRIVVRVASPTLRLVDFEIHWRAERDVAVRPTNHALFAIRAAMDLTPWEGGTLVNAEGLSGEKGTFGKATAWCAFFGRRANLPPETVEGVALFDHPKNPWAPCPWFTRDYGFAGPNPFFFLKKPWQLPAGQSVTLRHRVVLFVGDPAQAGLDDLHRQWVS